MRKLLLVAVLVMFAFAIAVPAVGPAGIELVESAGIEITVNDNVQPAEFVSNDPPCPPSGSGSQC